MFRKKEPDYDKMGCGGDGALLKDLVGQGLSAGAANYVIEEYCWIPSVFEFLRGDGRFDARLKFAFPLPEKRRKSFAEKLPGDKWDSKDDGNLMIVLRTTYSDPLAGKPEERENALRALAKDANKIWRAYKRESFLDNVESRFVKYLEGLGAEERENYGLRRRPLS
jgi:hypothetical protein